MGNGRRILALMIGLTVGCTPTTPPPEIGAITTANHAIDSGQSDQAIEAAQAYLRGSPAGASAAEAWYLQGRGFEQKATRNESSPGVIRGLLEQARSCYVQALNQGPAPSLAGDIHAQFFNVAFYQDDYPESIQQASRAIGLTESNDVKAHLLYSIGVCQQRLARFNDADQTYRQVEQRYAGTAWADAARSAEGMRQFYVQLGTYADPAAADRVLLSMQNSGYVLSKVDKKGKTVVQAGPFSTYADAKSAKDKIGGSFPGVVVFP